MKLYFAFLAVSAIFALPVNAQCTADGPSLDATEKYIKANSDVTAMASDLSSGHTAFSKDKYSYVRVEFMNIDCSLIRSATSEGGQMYAYLFCKNKMNCATPHSYNLVHEWWDEQDPTSFYALGTQSGDSQQTGNLARALQHYVFLLQAQYRQSHNSASDPFAAPN